MRAAAILVTFSCLVASAGAQTASPPPVYDVRELPIPEGSGGIRPTAVGNDGTVAGYVLGGVIHGASTRPFVFSSAGEMTRLGLNGEALGLNELGDVVGVQRDIGGPGFLFHYGDGSWQLLNPFGVSDPMATGSANAVNESREVVGAASNGSARHAFLLRLPETRALDLHPAGAESSSAVAINDLGEAVGLVTTAGDTHGVLWQTTVAGIIQVRDLEVELGRDFSPSALNSRGAVVGDTVVDGRSRAARLVDGVLTELGTLGGVSSKALGVNDPGQVVGYAVAVGADGAMRAFVWQGGTQYDLNQRLAQALGVVLLQATALNDAGQIVAWGATGATPETTVIRAFLLTPRAPVTPAATIGGLIEEVRELRRSGELRRGQAASLIAELQLALWFLRFPHGERMAAVMLDLFVRHIELYVRTGVLSPEEGSPLLETARGVIAQLRAP